MSCVSVVIESLSWPQRGVDIACCLSVSARSLAMAMALSVLVVCGSGVYAGNQSSVSAMRSCPVSVMYVR